MLPVPPPVLRRLASFVAACLVAGSAQGADAGDARSAAPKASASRDIGARAPRAAFFYGHEVPNELEAHFDRVVVEPDVVAGAPGAAWVARIPTAVDARALAARVEALHGRGYRGFFFDRDAPCRRAPRACDGAIAAAVVATKRRYPDAVVLAADAPGLTRGVDGVVAEDVLTALDTATGARVEVPRAQAAARLAELAARGVALGAPVTVLETAPAHAPERRRAVALVLRAAGLGAYVTSADRNDVGTSDVEVLPRRILLAYRAGAPWLGTEDACTLVAPVLEHFGYAVDYLDLARPVLPAVDRARYAGVVVWTAQAAPDPAAYRAWVAGLLDRGVRVAFLGGLGLDDEGLLTRLGLRAGAGVARAPLRVADAGDDVGLEARPIPRALRLPAAAVARADVRSTLRLEDAGGERWDGVVTAPWGGAAFDPYVLDESMDGERRWVLDPFRFLAKALALPELPLPDVTTEGGRRILTAHVDGDAFVSRAERPGTPYTGEVIRDDILRRYSIPHTVSFVEGEIAPNGLKPSESADLERVARTIAALPNVELASHTFSHPFFWSDAEAGRFAPHGAEVVHLPIPGYVFDLGREIDGSVSYLEGRVAPPGKRVRVLLWSGDCAPGAAAVARTRALGLWNVNGGGATRTRDLPSLTRGSAMGIPLAGGAYQVFAPVENENVFTGDFRGPLHGYRRAIETFELTERPRRLGIVTLYYHFYSAAKHAALVALKDVYAWALAQETTPLFLSDYAARVDAFQRASVARRIDDGALEYGGLGALRTLRVARTWGQPDLVRSAGVAGFRDGATGRYVTLVQDVGRPVLVPAAAAARAPVPSLVSANGIVERWALEPGGVRLRVRGYVPLRIVVAGPRCSLFAAGRRIEGARDAAGTRFELAAHDTGEARLACR